MNLFEHIQRITININAPKMQNTPYKYIYEKTNTFAYAYEYMLQRLCLHLLLQKPI